MAMSFSRADALQVYRDMKMIRCFEDIVARLVKEDRVFGNMHLYTGEEAIAVGVAHALKADDLMTSTHRSNGHLLARGGDPRKMFAEIMGRTDGYCKGYGGKMHYFAVELGFYGANGIVGANIPIAAGLALNAKLQKTRDVVACFFGDGASNHGYFHEGLNIAALWRLPLIFICENNQYAISTHVSRSVSCGTIATRAVAYGIPGITVNGNDVEAVYSAAVDAASRAREGKGPSLLECVTYRVRGHHEGDLQVYRNEEELKEALDQDPITHFSSRLRETYRVQEEELSEIDRQVQQSLEEALKLAEASPWAQELITY